LALASLYLRPVQAEDAVTIQDTIRKRFPSVRQLSPAALAAWLADETRPAPLLVDVREAAEFGVSHLKNAVHITAVRDIKARLATPDSPVVVYCSVGYRSSAVAQDLIRLGCTNVWNLEGSIFAWANAGHPVYRGTNPVSEVHPYSAKWGRLLESRFHPPRHRNKPE
jgi:rhodanese-related sulfurtransferase